LLELNRIQTFEIHGIFAAASLCRIIMLKLTKAITQTEAE